MCLSLSTDPGFMVPKLVQVGNEKTNSQLQYAQAKTGCWEAPGQHEALFTSWG